MTLTLTVDEIMDLGPCKGYPRERVEELFAGRARLSALDILELDIPAQARLWAVLRPELIPEHILHELACRFAEAALMRECEAGREPDPRSWAAIEAKRKWLRGEITGDELTAARSAAWSARVVRDAARDAARSAALVAAWSARDAARSAALAAARSARDAARSAAWSARGAARYAARYAALVEQVEIVRQMLAEAAREGGDGMSNPVFLPGQTVCPFCLSPRSNEGKVLQFSCGTRIYPTNEVVDRRIPCFRREIEDLRKQVVTPDNIYRGQMRELMQEVQQLSRDKIDLEANFNDMHDEYINLLAVAQTAKDVWLWYSCVAEGGRVDEIEHLGEKLARWEAANK